MEAIEDPFDYSTMELLPEFDHLIFIETTSSNSLCYVIEAIQSKG